MGTKSIPSRFPRESIDPDSSLASPPDDEAIGNFCCDTDVEVVPNTFDERIVPPKKRHCLGTSDISREGSLEPLLNLDSCIFCEVADERVTRCSGVDCLLWFHGECLFTNLGSSSSSSSSSSSEELANLYCPYCWLKILTLKSKTLREKTDVVEKATMKYHDTELKSRNEDRTLSGGGNENQEHSVDGTDIVSDQELQREKDHCSAESKGSSSERNREDLTEQVTSSAQVSSPPGKMKNQKATTVVEAKSKTARDISFFKKDQRRRVLWTYEEEEMLKVGVEKFEGESKKNMPWKKILEMGEEVFHETRSPADLKDKWRTMVGSRLGPKTNKTATH